jgi:alkylation response protein AidB-like acyl-CoA dehydrogenase
MTFELSAEHQALRDQARAFAQTVVAPQASTIDRDAAIPEEVLHHARALLPRDPDRLALVIAAEAVAAASGAVALAAFAGGHGSLSSPLAGLCGVRGLDASSATPLILAATAVGIGRAAVDRAVADLRAAQAGTTGSSEKPHWAVADAATEVEAGRLLTYRAATGPGAAAADATMARLAATQAAQKAVDIALRIAGAAGYQDGALLERLARDARALALLVDGEDAWREDIAEELFPAFRSGAHNG